MVNRTGLQSRPLQSRHRRSGFTLIELMGVILLTLLITAGIHQIFSEMTFQSQRAVVRTHASRQATAILDRIARDLQEAFLIIKPPEVDPLNHPWIFYSENDADNDRILFFTRNHQPRGANPREWDLTKVAYFLEYDDDGISSLWRWVIPGIPGEYLKDFPSIYDPGVSLVSQDIEELHFEFRSFVATEWSRGWDSSQLEFSGQLPLAVYIEISIVDPYALESETDEELLQYSRVVQIQLPAFSEEMIFSTSKEGEKDPLCEERGLGLEVDDCVDHGHPDYDGGDPDMLFNTIPKSGCFYNYIGVLKTFDDYGPIIDEDRFEDCGIVLDNWEEDQGQ